MLGSHRFNHGFRLPNRFAQILQGMLKLICMHTVQANTYARKRQFRLDSTTYDRQSIDLGIAHDTSTETVIRACWPALISWTIVSPGIASKGAICGFAETYAGSTVELM
jgi:hypothetical protein